MLQKMLIFVVLFRGSLFTNNTHPQIFLAYLFIDELRRQN